MPKGLDWIESARQLLPPLRKRAGAVASTVTGTTAKAWGGLKARCGEVLGRLARQPLVEKALRPLRPVVERIRPPLQALWARFRPRILDRYMLQSFAVPFLYCVLGFLALWILYDLQDNGADFAQARASLGTILDFYVRQMPLMLVLTLPIALMLGLLYSLSRMCRRNEVISMLTAGVSLPRLLLPLMIMGAAATALSTIFNLELAPRA